MTSLITLRYPTADMAVLVERDPDVSKDRCLVTGDANDPVQIEEDLLLDGSEFSLSVDRSDAEFDEAEILRGHVRLTAAYLGDMFAAYLARRLDELDAPTGLDLGDGYADEFVASALLGRFDTTAEVLRLVDEASTEQLASLRGEDVVRALRLDDENVRLRTLKALDDSGAVRL